jgi:ectoine hydroxylase-related dioxygenase (phytanoyl-CoA dioxygenase family)
VYDVVYRIVDKTRGDLTRPVHVEATQDELDAFMRDGYLLRRGLFADRFERYGAAVDAIVERERDHPNAERLKNNGLYVRNLLDKDETFHDLIRFNPTLSVARALLGPQVAIGLEARVAFAGVSEAGVNWHIHLRIVPDPLPPLFVFPHQVHGLIYLDHVHQPEGPLVVVPGSHSEVHRQLPGDSSDVPGQVELEFEPGDCILLQPNLWHRTQPTRPGCGRRRLLLFGYAPAWIKSELARGVSVADPLTDRLKAEGDEELVELLDGFHW